MAHVVTQACCGDASCVFACPVNAIHPTPDEADFGLAEMLYIDPKSCVDCGACVGACPVGAIVPDTKIAADQLPFVDINALFFADGRGYPIQAPVAPIVRKGAGSLRVAIVGAGPAAMYAADELLKQSGADVTVIDRLPTPHGLVRAGVAPDHQRTKTIEGLFRKIEDQPGFHYLLNVEVGQHITHEELLEHHHAVLYATGASHDRALEIPGVDLPGSETATNFVAWYNGHPDHVAHDFNLSGERAVVVGNGNVALDVARILTTDPERLASTDIADHALKALRGSVIREVVLLGRRGVAQAAFTLPELTALLVRPDIDIVVENADFDVECEGPMVQHKIDVLRAAANRPSRGERRIVFRFETSPTEIVGTDRVSGVQMTRNALVSDGDSVRAVPTDDHASIDASLILRSIGYRGVPIAGVPFDERAHVIPHRSGRVVGAPRTYVVGWIKRGPSGFIGTNKSCAEETVSHLVSDFNAGALGASVRSVRSMSALIRRRNPSAIGMDGWRSIDSAERLAGSLNGQPRRKFTSRDDMLEVAHPRVDWKQLSST